MNSFRPHVWCVLALLLLAPSARAQSTDAYHSIQLFPVVVESASFTQRFTFRNPNTINAISVAATFYPGAGTSQATPLACTSIAVAANGVTVVDGLRSLCPGLAPGTQFGFLQATESGGQSRPFAAFSRVSNIAGQGFSVEAFPAHTFTSADAVVTGARRLAAAAGLPAFQTNCFIGNLNEVTPAVVPVTTPIAVAVYRDSGALLGSTLVNLPPGGFVRLLDVFAAVGAAPGDYDDAHVGFTELGPDEPGLMTFCTVQDNTSFGADFRIGKQEMGDGPRGVGAKDDHVQRDSIATADVPMSGLSARAFQLPAGLAGINIHVMYFRHPDRVQCGLVDPVTSAPLAASYGLELRLLGPDGATVLAGGDNSTAFGAIYLGDKTDRNFGANTRYTLEVEDNGANTGAARPYGLHCQSGSGHGGGDIIRYNEPGTRF